MSKHERWIDLLKDNSTAIEKGKKFSLLAFMSSMHFSKFLKTSPSCLEFITRL
jgi:hypothetical protein